MHVVFTSQGFCPTVAVQLSRALHSLRDGAANEFLDHMRAAQHTSHGRSIVAPRLIEATVPNLR